MYYWGLHGFSCFHLLANFNRETCQFHWMRSFSRHSHNQFDPFQKNLEGLMMVHFQRTYGEVRSVPAIGNCSAAAPTFGPILTPQTWKLSTCPWPAWPEPVTCEDAPAHHAAKASTLQPWLYFCARFSSRYVNVLEEKFIPPRERVVLTCFDHRKKSQVFNYIANFSWLKLHSCQLQINKPQLINLRG